MEKKFTFFTFGYHQWGANEKNMDMINRRNKSPKIFRLVEKRQKITKPGNLQFKFHSNLNRKVCLSRRLDKRGRDEVAAIDLELLFRNNKKNRWGGGYFKFNEPRTSTSMQKNRQETLSINEESEVVPPTASSPILDLK